MHAIAQTKSAKSPAERIQQTVLAQVLQNLRQISGWHIQPTGNIAIQHRLPNWLGGDVNQGLNGILAGAG
jgi:hypothetical protein